MFVRPCGNVGCNDIPLHAVDVGQLTEEAEPVVYQGCDAFSLFGYLTHPVGFKGT